MLEGGHSDPRNSVIIKMFSMLHIGERAGSGMSRIISAWSAAGYENPVVEELIGNIERTTLTLPLTHVAKGTQEMFKGIQETAKGTQECTQKNATTSISEAESTQKRSALDKGTQEIVAKVPKKTIKRAGTIELGKTANAILNAILVQPTVTREMLAEQLKVSEATIKKHLKNFRDMGLIERIGANKGGYWKVKK